MMTLFGGKNGVSTLLKNKSPAALFVHCINHVLNLGVCRSVHSSNCGIVFEVLKKTASFFHISAKRTTYLANAIKALIPDSQRSRVPNLGDTRWVARHTCIKSFHILFQPILVTWYTAKFAVACNFLNKFSNLLKIF